MFQFNVFCANSICYIISRIINALRVSHSRSSGQIPIRSCSDHRFGGYLRGFGQTGSSIPLTRFLTPLPKIRGLYIPTFWSIIEQQPNAQTIITRRATDFQPVFLLAFYCVCCVLPALLLPHVRFALCCNFVIRPHHSHHRAVSAQVPVVFV